MASHSKIYVAIFISCCVACFTDNMPSDAAKKRQAKKKLQAQSRGKPKTTNNEKQTTTNGTDVVNGAVNGDTIASCTGVLASHPESRDVHIENFSITFHGVELLADTRLELNCGRRYGLLGLNGCGKIDFHQLSLVSHFDNN